MVRTKKFVFQNGVRLRLYANDVKFDGILSIPNCETEYQFADWNKDRVGKVMRQLGKLTLEEIKLAWAYYQISSKGFRTCLKWASNNARKIKMKQAVEQRIS